MFPDVSESHYCKTVVTWNKLILRSSLEVKSWILRMEVIRGRKKRQRNKDKLRLWQAYQGQNALAWWTLKFQTCDWTLSCAFSFSLSLAPTSSSSVNHLHPQDQLVLDHFCFTVVTFTDLPSCLMWGSCLTSRISCILAQSTLHPLSIQTPPRTCLMHSDDSDPVSLWNAMILRFLNWS